MADQHPISLRPGGPSPSSTPQPTPQQQYQSRQPSGVSPLPGAANQSQSLPSSQPSNYSTRFPSSQYPAPQSPTTDNASSAVNPFADSASRSRGSTIGQNYPITVAGQSSMANSPPTQTAQPLFAQHSGHQSSRPISRGGPQSQPTGTASMPPMPTGSGPSTRPTSSKSPFSTPITSPPRNRPFQILLINPNGTRSMTDNCLASVRPSIPPGVELTGYTAPYPAPTAIESVTDAIMSTEAVLRDLAKYSATNGETVQNFDGMIVACYSKHPLIDALRESYDVPVIGIMEASLYVARMLGGRFGIVATASRSKILQDDAIAAYGLSHFYVGSEATHLGVLELETRSREEVLKRVALCARALAVKGADTILLGCAGMTDMVRAAKDGVRDEDGRRTVNVIDGVEAAVMMMSALVGMGIPTSKKGQYRSEKEGRRTRGQNWL